MNRQRTAIPHHDVDFLFSIIYLLGFSLLCQMTSVCKTLIPTLYFQRPSTNISLQPFPGKNNPLPTSPGKDRSGKDSLIRIKVCRLDFLGQSLCESDRNSLPLQGFLEILLKSFCFFNKILNFNKLSISKWD